MLVIATASALVVGSGDVRDADFDGGGGGGGWDDPDAPESGPDPDEEHRDAFACGSCCSGTRWPGEVSRCDTWKRERTFGEGPCAPAFFYCTHPTVAGRWRGMNGGDPTFDDGCCCITVPLGCCDSCCTGGRDEPLVGCSEEKQKARKKPQSSAMAY